MPPTDYEPRTDAFAEMTEEDWLSYEIWLEEVFAELPEPTEESEF